MRGRCSLVPRPSSKEERRVWHSPDPPFLFSVEGGSGDETREGEEGRGGDISFASPDLLLCSVIVSSSDHRCKGREGGGAAWEQG